MVNGETVYLDYAATTPVSETVLEAMLPYFQQTFGNPSSIHYFGQQAENALDESRRLTARQLNAQTDEIIFTGCGTESDNLALRGAALMEREKRGANRLLISPVEHHAVSYTAKQLRDQFGFELDFLPVDPFGQVNPADVARMLRPETALVSVIYANNEIGTINPIAEIGAVCREHGVLFHSDAVQAAAHLKMDVKRDQVDLLSIGAHKFYGPKGVGALYVRKGVKLLPSQTGGKQEAGLRAGTQNIPYIVGLAKALEIAQLGCQQREQVYLPLRNHLIGQVLELIPEAQLTGHPYHRLPNHASFVFKGVDGNALLVLLDVAGFACSSGSACKVGSPEPSDILIAMGLSRDWALGSLRLTLGQNTRPEDIERLLAVLPEAVQRVRGR
jgi:cysteine desulfurase